MQDKLDRVNIILVEPQDSSNVGGVCRALKTMGISRLTIVGREKEFFDVDRVYKLAIHAKDIFDTASYTDSLEEALSSSVLSAGVTRRRGKHRKFFSYTPEQFAEKSKYMETGEIAFVFGRESSGLSDKELHLCSTAVHIPSSQRFPSLNLSHAVQVCTYACYHTYGDEQALYSPIDRERLLEVVDTAIVSLEALDFFKQQEREETRQFFTDIFTRASISQTESKRMERIFRKIPAMALYRK